MKLTEQQEARRMRRDEGLSLNEIAARLQVSKSSASSWVRDIVLTEPQVAQLTAQNPLYNRQLLSSQLSRARSRIVRVGYQTAGRQRARQGDPLHMAGCMLYWAEGSKSRCDVGFTNSDPEMVAFFVRFLEHCYCVQKHEIAVYINCFDAQELVSGIEDFWLARLGLPRTQLRKTTVNYFSSYSQKKRISKLRYGTCRVNVHRTEIVQNIYGAIQEYAGFQCEKWLD
jgi:transcriptional regulator with XRE-family HTH domain